MKIEITVDEIGIGRIVVDGEDISNRIRGFTLRARAGELTKLRLEYAKVAAAVSAEVEP